MNPHLCINRVTCTPISKNPNKTYHSSHAHLLKQANSNRRKSQFQRSIPIRSHANSNRAVLFQSAKLKYHNPNWKGIQTWPKFPSIHRSRSLEMIYQIASVARNHPKANRKITNKKVIWETDPQTDSISETGSEIKSRILKIPKRMFGSKKDTNIWTDLKKKKRDSVP